MAGLSGKKSGLVAKRRNQRDLRRALAPLAFLVAVVIGVAFMLPAVSMTHGDLVCDMEEHAHSKDCYEQVLVCGMEEGEGAQPATDDEPAVEGHKHTTDCYEKQLTCDIPEHKHTDTCFAEAEPEPAKPADADAISSGGADDKPASQDAATNGEDAGQSANQDAYGETQITDNQDEEASRQEGESIESESEAMPAQSFEATLKDADGKDVMTVNVKAPKGVLPDNIMMKIDGVDPKKVWEPVQSAVKRAAAEDTAMQKAMARAGATDDVALMTVVDIVFLDEAGNVVEPAKKLTVKITSDMVRDMPHPAYPFLARVTGDRNAKDDAKRYADAEMVVKKVKVVNQDDENMSKGAEDTLEFKADKFGPYAIMQLADAEAADERATEKEAEQSEEPEKEAVVGPAMTLEREVVDKDGNVALKLVVDVPENALPEGTSMHASLVEDKDVINAATEAAADEAGIVAERAETLAADITFVDAEGNPVEPVKALHVQMSAPAVAEQDQIAVVHVDDESNAQVVRGEEVSKGEQTVAFDAEEFSVYAIVYTVDFHWEVDGKQYEFSIPGGGFVTLQQLVEVLDIANVNAYSENALDDAGKSGDLNEGVNDYSVGEVPGEDAESAYAEDEDNQGEKKLTLTDVEITERTKEFVSNIENVEFSSPNLVWVGKVDTNNTVGGLKEANNLDCQYSAELTEEQKDEINSSAVEAGDWALICMQPFMSEENLTITMNTGEVFTISVTDAMYDIAWSKPGETSTLLNFREWVSLGFMGGYYQTRQSVRVYYVDQNGHRIVKPSQVSSTTDIDIGTWNNDAFEYSISSDTVAKEIGGYTYLGAHADRYDGESVNRVIINRTDNFGYTYSTQLRNGNANVDGSSIYLVYDGDGSASIDNTTTVHFGYMDGDSFVEFPESMKPSDAITATNEEFGWHHLIYDFYGTDDGKPFQYRYSGTYYSANGATNSPVANGTRIQPLLRYYENNWTYFEGVEYSNASITTNQNWKKIKDDSDIYVVYDKPTIPPGGKPTLKSDGQLPDAPNILKESVENADGTNTLSLSVTGSRKPMVAEKVADVIVILDLSTSMSRAIDSREKYADYVNNQNSRFYQAKQALQKLADNLYARNDQSGDSQYRLGLITFSNKGDIKQLPTENRQVFQQALDDIDAHDTAEGTNWEHSLMLANQLDLPTDRATYIVFITDGAPTVRQTRLNLTDVQLDGYVRDNKNDHGDIFHGGLNNGSFYDNNNGYLDDRKHFRDYLGNGSFGGIMDDDEWARRNREAAIDEVESIIDHKKGFFAIGVSNDAASLEYFVKTECGLSEDHYELVSNESSFLGAIDSIVENLNGMTGQADVRMLDGITGLTQTISKVNQEENRLVGADGNFTYWKSNTPTGYTSATWEETWKSWTAGQKDAYNFGIKYAGVTQLTEQTMGTGDYGKYSSFSSEENTAFSIGQTVTFSEWTTRETDGCAPAAYNTATGAVEWNMGETFMLEDGVTYKVSFICWPSQDAYDIIAKLENGTIQFSELDADVQAQFEGNATDGYTLKTNAEGANTRYRSATSVSGNVSPGDEQDPLEFQHVPPMPLAEDYLNIAKTWQASKIDTQDPESVILQVVGDDDLYKEFEIAPAQMLEGSTTNNYASSGNIYISCGHLKVNRDTGKVVIYESGHDFTLREVGENSRHWDLDASVCRPMKINTIPTMLVVVDDEEVPAGMTSSTDYYASDNDEYYRIDGKVYKVDQAFTDITGMNTRRSFLDLAKEVLVGGEVLTGSVNEKFTYKITINVDPTTLSWDHDLEKYIAISVIDANGTVSPASILADETYPTTAKLPSTCGFNESNDSKYLIADTGVEFYLSIKNGWSVRFLNLPVGTTYSIEEVLPADSDYEFNNLRLETRKDRKSENPDSTQTYTVKTINGSIAETSTLYKVVYQNEPKKGSLQITKSVTIDNGDIDPTETDWAAGVYNFTITDANGNPAVGKVSGEWIVDGKVSITITNGASNTVTVTDMPIGEYTITEDTPDNDAILVAFSVNGTQKAVTNGVVAENDKKITVAESETGVVSFTNNVNTTKVRVKKAWADGTTDHDPIEYKLYRIVYGMVDDPDHAGEKIRVNYNTAQEVNDTTVPGLTAEKGFTGVLGNSNSWTETVSKLPKAGVYVPQGAVDPVVVFYDYYVTEESSVSGYMYSLDGHVITDASEIPDGNEDLEVGDYLYVITNEPLSSTDQLTHVDVEKEWKDSEGNTDTDLHKDDFIVFQLKQKKYKAQATYTYEGVTETKNLYPITVNLVDKFGNNVERVSHTTVVYVPEGASFTIDPDYLGHATNNQHTVEVTGISVTSGTSPQTQTYSDKPGITYYYTGCTFTIQNVNEAKEIRVSLHDGNDVWKSLTVSGETVNLINNPGNNDDEHSWTCVMSSPQGIIWDLSTMFEKVLSGAAYLTPGSDTPIPQVTPYNYTMRLTNDSPNGLPTVFVNGDNTQGHAKGDQNVVWKGRVDDLPLYVYQDANDHNSYIYTYEMAEYEIGSDSVVPLTTPQNPENAWSNQTTSYLVKWNQNTTTGVWTMTNQKKPPIDISIYKVDESNLESGSPRLKGAAFKLVKYSRLTPVKTIDTTWQPQGSTTPGESPVVSEQSGNPGVFTFADLDAGYYEIVETHYPDGYNHVSENPIFEVKYTKGSVEPEIVLVYASGPNIGQPITGNATELVKIGQVETSQDGETINWTNAGAYDGTISADITVGNTPGAALPNTGGPGTSLFNFVGCILVILAGAGIFLVRRRRPTP